VDGGARENVGMGHIYRACLIASSLVKNGHTALFVSSSSVELKAGRDEILRNGYELLLLESIDISSIINDYKPNLVIIDLYKYTKQDLLPYRNTGAQLFTFDHIDETSCYSDFCINPCIVNGNKKYDGLKYAILPEPVRLKKSLIPKSIVISFGGYDFGGLTSRLVNLTKNIVGDINITFVVGSKLINKLNFFEKANADKRVKICVNPVNFNQIIALADIAVIAGGVTLFQCISEGVPSIVIAQYEHQKEFVNSIAQYEACKLLGMHDEVNDEMIVTAINTLISNDKIRGMYEKNALSLIDGKGLERFTNLVNKTLGGIE